MRLECIDKVRENEILGKNIYSYDGKILLKAGAKLTNSYIKALKRQGILCVYIKDDRLEDVVLEDSEFLKIKQEAMGSVSKIIKNIHNIKAENLKKSLESVENIIDYIVNLNSVNIGLYDIKTYNNYTYLHSLDTCIRTSFIGIACGLNKHELKILGTGAILHDIGKTKISKSIIEKKSRLTDAEFQEVKKHTLYGGEILRQRFDMPKSIIDIVEQHHERVDKRGYPYGLGDKQISKFAKMVSICDVYDAISNDRCYRKKFSPNDAYELILSGAGTIFDRELVKVFRNTFSIYNLGSRVKLSNGDIGYVIKQNKGFPDRPIVRVFYDEFTYIDKYINTNYYEVDLLNNPDIIIKDI